MSTSVQFNGIAINNVTYITENTTHDGAPTRSISSFKIARRDGEKLVSAFWGSKEIDINGYIVGTSQSDFESKVDSLKLLLSYQASNLDITYNGITRRYIATATEIKVNRDSDNIDWAPYSVKFLVPLGYGSDTSEILAFSTISSITTTPVTEIVSFNGSYNPKARHKITMATRGNADVVRIENIATGAFMDVDLNGFSAGGDYFEIDEKNQTVLKNGTTTINYRGIFPSSFPGSNNLQISVIGSSYLEDQFNDTYTGAQSILWDNRVNSISPVEAQSFIAGQSGHIGKIVLNLKKVGAPGGNATFAIYSDNNGVPGSQIGGAFTQPISGITTSSAWHSMTLSSSLPELVAGNKYWIVNNSITYITGSNSSNCLNWYHGANSTDYPFGDAIVQKNNTSVFVYGCANSGNVPNGEDIGIFDFEFEEYIGDGNAPSWSIAWEIFYTPNYL